MEPEHYAGIKRFVEFWSDAPMVRETFKAFVSEAEADNDAVIDAAKGMVECCCRRLIEEFVDDGNEVLKKKRVTLPELMAEANQVLKIDDGRHLALRKLALKHIELVKNLRATELVEDISATSRAKVDVFRETLGKIADELVNELDHDRTLAKLVSGHVKLGQELNSIRNEAGPLSHGKSGFLEPLADNHRKKAVIAADTIIDFYHSIYQEVETNFEFTRLPYESFARKNKIIDSQGAWHVEAGDGFEGEEAIVLSAISGVRVIVPLSKFLFDNDRTAYIEILRQLDDSYGEEDET